jgi:hypothetical protein
MPLNEALRILVFGSYHKDNEPTLLKLINYLRKKGFTNFDDQNRITQAYLLFDFKWMRGIFKKYFNI